MKSWNEIRKAATALTGKAAILAAQGGAKQVRPVLPQLFRSVILRHGLRYYGAERGGVCFRFCFCF